MFKNYLSKLRTASLIPRAIPSAIAADFSTRLSRMDPSNETSPVVVIFLVLDASKMNII